MFMVTDEKAYLCRRCMFPAYAGFVLDSVIKMGAVEFFWPAIRQIELSVVRGQSLFEHWFCAFKRTRP